MKQDTLYAHSSESLTCMALAVGYFMYDVYICIWRYSENGFEYLIHAVLCCLAYLYPIYSNHLNYMGAAFLMWEGSTPFLYLRWYILKSGRGSTKYMSIANALFALSFFCCRVVYGPGKMLHPFESDILRRI